MSLGERIKFYREKLGLTQEDVAKRINTTPQNIYKYEKGIITNVPLANIEALAAIFEISPIELTGWEGAEKTSSDFDNILSVARHRIPLIGEIACGKPIMAEQDFERYVEAGANIQVDFALRCKGDSMINARIHDGDIVFIRKQNIVDNGEIAAVIIENEATLKRVYFYAEKNKLILQAENPQYEPLVYIGAELEQVTIIGKAVAFQSDVK